MYLTLQNALTKANRQSTSRTTNDLIHGLFSMEFQATHSLAGGNKDKPPLPSSVVDRVICKCYHSTLYVFVRDVGWFIASPGRAIGLVVCLSPFIRKHVLAFSYIICLLYY